MSILDGDAYACQIHVFGKQAGAVCGDAIYTAKVNRYGSITGMTGTVQTLAAWEAASALGTPVFSITADDVNDALSFKVTPANSVATNWMAVVDYAKLSL